MKNDRFLISILIGILLIVLVALGLYFQRQAVPSYRDGTNPDDIVHNYALALSQADYEKAYGYLAEGKLKPGFDTFRRAFLTNELNISNASLRTDQADIVKEEALVPVTVLQAGGGLFGDIMRMEYTGILVLQDGEWKIKDLPYPYMNWNWVNPPTPEEQLKQGF